MEPLQAVAPGPLQAVVPSAAASWQVIGRVAAYFAGRDPEDKIGSHNRPIGIDKCVELGLKVNDVRRNPGLQSRIRDLHHAVNLTIAETGAYKLVENNLDQAFIRAINIAQVGSEAPAVPGAVGTPARPN